MGTLTLTGLIPTIYAAMDEVSREEAGMIRAVSMDSTAERAALNQVVMSPVVGAMASENLVASNVPADTPNQTVLNVQITISKAKSVAFGITGEENRGLNNAGTKQNINAMRIAHAMRTLTNEIETDLTGTHVSASRAFGTATGTPFGTAGDYADFAGARRILTDNGAPSGRLKMVLSPSNVERMRGKQSGLLRVNEAGSDELLRTGNLGTVQAFAMGESRQTRTAVTVGTGASYVTSVAALTVGQTDIPIITGTGTVLAGDIVSFANDPNFYVVKTGVAAAGTIVLQEPGLLVAQASASRVMTITAATTRSMFFHQGAIQLAMRAPAMPDEGDMADDVMMLQDPFSGITYEFVIYKGKRQVRYEVNAAWGWAVVQPRHVGLLIGA